MGGSEFSRSFDRVAEIYDATRGLPGEVMERLMETLSAELNGCTEILDIGVGTGRLAEPLQDTGFEMVGIDISRKMAGKAREKGVKQLLLADARFLPFKPEAFDARYARALNLKIVEELKTRFVGKVFKQELFLLVWDINSLKAYVDNLQRC